MSVSVACEEQDSQSFLLENLSSASKGDSQWSEGNENDALNLSNGGNYLNQSSSGLLLKPMNFEPCETSQNSGRPMNFEPCETSQNSGEPLNFEPCETAQNSRGPMNFEPCDASDHFEGPSQESKVENKFHNINQTGNFMHVTANEQETLQGYLTNQPHVDELEPMTHDPTDDGDCSEDSDEGSASNGEQQCIDLSVEKYAATENAHVHPSYGDYGDRESSKPHNSSHAGFQQYYHRSDGYDGHQYVQLSYIQQAYYTVDNAPSSGRYIVDSCHGNGASETTSKLELLQRRE